MLSRELGGIVRRRAWGLDMPADRRSPLRNPSREFEVRNKARKNCWAGGLGRHGLRCPLRQGFPNQHPGAKPPVRPRKVWGRSPQVSVSVSPAEAPSPDWPKRGDRILHHTTRSIIGR